MFKYSIDEKMIKKNGEKLSKSAIERGVSLSLWEPLFFKKQKKKIEEERTKKWETAARTKPAAVRRSVAPLLLMPISIQVQTTPLSASSSPAATKAASLRSRFSFCLYHSPLKFRFLVLFIGISIFVAPIFLDWDKVLNLFQRSLHL